MTTGENFNRNASCKHGHPSAMSNSAWCDLNRNCTVFKLHDTTIFIQTSPCWIWHSRTVFIFTFSLLNRSFSSSHLLCKKLWFITIANTTLSFYNFNKFFILRVHLFIHILIYSITIKSSSHTPCLCHLNTKNHIQEEHLVQKIFVFLF